MNHPRVSILESSKNFLEYNYNRQKGTQIIADESQTCHLGQKQVCVFL